MIISSFGDGFLRVQNGETVMTVDPTNARQKADVVLYTAADPDALDTSPGVVSSAGEYEVAGIDILGWQLPDKKEMKTAYLVTWDGIRLLFLGGATALPDAHALETIELLGVDVLVVPGDTKRYLPTEALTKFIKEVEPSAIISTHTKDPQAFAKALGKAEPAQEKFVFKKKDLPEGAMRAIVLESR